ncbi:MAG TPA: hypothetical protein VFF27_16670 [Bacteroidia bacterium]|nr:hypothetical protein [Bacteroidia bacterium]
MMKYTIPNNQVYTKWEDRLKYLKGVNPQTEEIANEIRLIEEELIKFKIIQNCIRNN